MHFDYISAQGLTETHYRLDANDRIISVGGDWDKFALANGGYDAVADRVVGTSLWTNVEGDSTRMYLEAVLMRVRLETAPITIDYFCNSPEMRRRSRVEWSLETDGSVLSKHKILNLLPIVKRKPRPVEAKSLVKACTICRRVRLDDTWVTADEARAVPDHSRYFGLCEDCKDLDLAKLRKRI